MKKITLLIILSFSSSSFSQSLTIEETLDYLNKITTDEYWQPIKINEEGKVIFGDRFIMDFKNTNYKWITANVGGNGSPYIQVSFQGYGIVSTNYNGKKETKTWDNLNPRSLSLNECKKIANALKYLASLIKSDDRFNVKDDDPFSPNNFIKNSIEITNTVENNIIELTKKSGVYHIYITIGGISEEFIFDTGASEVLISRELESKLISNEVVKKNDYLEDGLYRIADGSIIKQRRLIIPKLQIGNFIVANVRASVTNSNTLLLGKSVLDKFKSWNINNLNQTLELIK